MWALAVSLLAYAWRVRGQASLRANWLRVLRDPVAASAGLLLGLFFLLTLADSVHFRLALPSGDGPRHYDTQTHSLLDALLRRQIAMRETSYSAPLAYRAFNKGAAVGDATAAQPVVDGQTPPHHDRPRLQFGGAHLEDPVQQWAPDVGRRVACGMAAGLSVTLLLSAGVALGLSKTHGGVNRAWLALVADRTHYPWRALLGTVGIVALCVGVVVALMSNYHVFGTDQTGNDVFYQALKSIRTAFVIGALSTLATLPLALGLGVLAGYYKGWVDEVIQYIYTLLTSVPNVLLIAACVLMVQVFLDTHPDAFETGAERADLKMFLLCLILGLTGWAGLCRLVRGETLKLRELDYVQAATAFGVSDVRVMLRHIVPNLMHLVLITVVLSFSELILYEAVLTYVGVGVDPSMNSFGGMINLARSEMSRDPVVWWSFAAAFGVMVTLVLAANLFADGVRDAFDPRARQTRLRVQPPSRKAEG
nr:ABC transporter permease [Roseateles koreensis]